MKTASVWIADTTTIGARLSLSDLEEKYNLHKADRKQRQADNPLRKVDVSQGNVKKQVANTVKSLCATYRFQSLGEYRALLSLYNISLEEVRGEVGGREYHGFVYSATDGQGNKVGNPFKASKIDKSVGVEAIEKRFAYSAKKFKEDKKLSEMTKHSVEAVLKQTYHKDKFIELLKAKGIDVVFRHTADGRIYGATFIDHRTQSVFNGSRLGTNLSANALQEHFTLPYENEQPIPLTIPKEDGTMAGTGTIMVLACSMSTAAVLDLWQGMVLPTRHRKQHSIESYAERKRSEKGETFNRIIKV